MRFGRVCGQSDRLGVNSLFECPIEQRKRLRTVGVCKLIETVLLNESLPSTRHQRYRIGIKLEPIETFDGCARIGRSKSPQVGRLQSGLMDLLKYYRISILLGIRDFGPPNRLSLKLLELLNLNRLTSSCRSPSFEAFIRCHRMNSAISLEALIG